MTRYSWLCLNTNAKQISLANKINFCKTGFLLKQVIFLLFNMLIIGIVLIWVIRDINLVYFLGMKLKVMYCSTKSAYFLLYLHKSRCWKGCSVKLVWVKTFLISLRNLNTNIIDFVQQFSKSLTIKKIIEFFQKTIKFYVLKSP
jgi:hypothetical protein